MTSTPVTPTPATPGSTARPTDLAGAAAALADTTGPVLITGAGTAADWAGSPGPVDVRLDTTGLTGIIAHNPGDMTVSVRAGTPLRELNEILGEHGQRVALDAARVARGATVGGLLATADSGPGALTFGSSRDLVIGATLVLADGTVARTGGHVIKNVAGYDLATLLHGSLGTLALVAEVVLRLHPEPAATTTVRREGSLTGSVEAARAVLAGPLDPVAVEWCAGGLLVRLDGQPDAVAARARRLVEQWEALDPRAGVHTLSGPDAERAWTGHAELVHTAPAGHAVLRVGARPSRLPGLLADLVELAGPAPDSGPPPGTGPAPVPGPAPGTGSAPDNGSGSSTGGSGHGSRSSTGGSGTGRVTAGLATGIGTVVLPADPGLLRHAHEVVHAAGGTSTLRARPGGVRLPGWGPAPSGIAVLRALKSRLDPAGRLGPGRFAPWLAEPRIHQAEAGGRTR